MQSITLNNLIGLNNLTLITSCKIFTCKEAIIITIYISSLLL